MQTLDFPSHEKDWWAWFMCHNPEAVDVITKAEGFNPEALQVKIEVNGVTVIAEDFNKLMERLVAESTKQQMEKLGLASTQKAADIEARSVVGNLLGNVETSANDLLSQLETFRGSLECIVRESWERPFIVDTAEKLQALCLEATVIDDKKEKYQSVQAYVTRDISHSMGNATIDVHGYGADEGEARSELERSLYILLGIKPAS